ncbi:MAG: hypothetical protein KF914_15010 [Rhizobiaceae bacterium]|nr:hypothetical protein [Rhizobiaceae bacterium]
MTLSGSGWYVLTGADFGAMKPAMTIRKSACRQAAVPLLLTALAVPVSGCTRTYDGTVVSTYQFVPMAGSPYGLYEMKPTDTLPPNRLYQFPPAPDPPPEALPAPDRLPPRRRAGGLIPKVDGDLPRAVACREERAGGRVRVVCL